MLAQNIALLSSALNTLQMSGIRSHMPFVFDENTFLCSLDTEPPASGRSCNWRAHYWTAEENVFKPIATQFSTKLECVPHAYRDETGQIQFFVVSDVTGDFNLHRFSGANFNNLVHNSMTRTAAAGAATSTTTITTDKFIAPILDVNVCGQTTHAMIIQKINDEYGPYFFVVRDNFVVLNVTPVYGSNSQFTTTLSSGNSFISLLFDVRNLTLAYKIVLPDATTPYKAHLAGSVLFYAQKSGDDFENRKIVITNTFELQPAPLFDYFLLGNDFFYNPYTVIPGV